MTNLVAITRDTPALVRGLNGSGAGKVTQKVTQKEKEKEKDLEA